MTNTTNVNVETVQNSPILSSPEIITNEQAIIQPTLWLEEEIKTSEKKVNELFGTIIKLFNSVEEGNLSVLQNALEGGLYQWLKENNQTLLDLQKNIKEQIDVHAHQLHKALPKRYSNEWMLSICEAISTKCKESKSSFTTNKPILNWSKAYSNKNVSDMTVEKFKNNFDYSELALQNDEQIKKSIKEHLAKSDDYFGENKPIKDLNRKGTLKLVVEHVFQQAKKLIENYTTELIEKIKEIKKDNQGLNGQNENWQSFNEYLKKLNIKFENLFDEYNNGMQQKSIALQFLEDQISYVNTLLELKNKLDPVANDTQAQAKVIINECILKEKCETLLSCAYKHGERSEIFNYLLEKSTCFSLATFCTDKENYTFLHKALSTFNQPSLYTLILSHLKKTKPTTEEEEKVQQTYLQTMQSLWTEWENIAMSKNFHDTLSDLTEKARKANEVCIQMEKSDNKNPAFQALAYVRKQITNYQLLTLINLVHKLENKVNYVLNEGADGYWNFDMLSCCFVDEERLRREDLVNDLNILEHQIKEEAIWYSLVDNMKSILDKKTTDIVRKQLANEELLSPVFFDFSDFITDCEKLYEKDSFKLKTPEKEIFTEKLDEEELVQQKFELSNLKLLEKFAKGKKELLYNEIKNCKTDNDIRDFGDRLENFLKKSKIKQIELNTVRDIKKTRRRPSIGKKNRPLVLSEHNLYMMSSSERGYQADVNNWNSIKKHTAGDILFIFVEPSKNWKAFLKQSDHRVKEIKIEKNLILDRVLQEITLDNMAIKKKDLKLLLQETSLVPGYSPFSVLEKALLAEALNKWGGHLLVTKPFLNKNEKLLDIAIKMKNGAPLAKFLLALGGVPLCWQPNQEGKFPLLVAYDYNNKNVLQEILDAIKRETQVIPLPQAGDTESLAGPNAFLKEYNKELEYRLLSFWGNLYQYFYENSNITRNRCYELTRYVQSLWDAKHTLDLRKIASIVMDAAQAVKEGALGQSVVRDQMLAWAKKVLEGGNDIAIINNTEQHLWNLHEMLRSWDAENKGSIKQTQNNENLASMIEILQKENNNLMENMQIKQEQISNLQRTVASLNKQNSELNKKLNSQTNVTEVKEALSEEQPENQGSFVFFSHV